jgi:adenylate cyclase
MNARLERKLRLLSGVVAAGIIAGIAFSAAMDRSLVVGIAYGLLMSLMLGGIELFVMEGPMLVGHGTCFARLVQRFTALRIVE